MCLLISIEVQHDERDQLVEAARAAGGHGLRVDVAHLPRWRWARDRPVVAKLTEDGGCSCSLLADDAESSASTWTLRPDIVPAVVATLKTLLGAGPDVVRVSALWAGDKPEHVEHLDAEDFLKRVSRHGLGTKTVYVIQGAV